MSAAVEFQPDLRLSVIKPLHCRWLMDAYAEMSSRPQLVRQGWETCGIIEMLLKLAGRDGTDDMECEPHVRHSVLTTYSPDNVPVKEFYLEHTQCQSRIDGRTGSHACTVIASLVARSASSGVLTVCDEPSHFPGSELPEHFVNEIRAGNKLYDEQFAPAGSPFLSTYDVVQKCPFLALTIPPLW